MTKNVLPIRILILGIGETDMNFVLKIKSNVNQDLKNLEKKLQKFVDVHLK